MKPIPVELDRTRHLRLDFNALATFEELTGREALAFDWFQSATCLRAFVYAALKHEDEKLTLEQVGEMLSRDQMGDITRKMTAAISRDWVADWKAGLHNPRVGRRFVLHPPGGEVELAPGDLPIAIEPGMAFGTSAHATTRGAIRLLEDAVEPGHRVLDVGTGSGVLAIAAARLGAGSVLAVDGDPVAVDVARDNVRSNGVSDAVRTSVAMVHPRYFAGGTPFDVIVANLLSDELIPLLPALRDALAAGGSLIVAGILEEQAGGFAAAADAAGFGTPRVDVEQGWWSAHFRAPRQSRHDGQDLGRGANSGVKHAPTRADASGRCASGKPAVARHPASDGRAGFAS